MDIEIAKIKRSIMEYSSAGEYIQCFKYGSITVAVFYIYIMMSDEKKK